MKIPWGNALAADSVSFEFAIDCSISSNTNFKVTQKGIPCDNNE